MTQERNDFHLGALPPRRLAGAAMTPRNLKDGPPPDPVTEPVLWRQYATLTLNAVADGNGYNNPLVVADHVAKTLRKAKAENREHDLELMTADLLESLKGTVKTKMSKQQSLPEAKPPASKATFSRPLADIKAEMAAKTEQPEPPRAEPGTPERDAELSFMEAEATDPGVLFITGTTDAPDTEPAHHQHTWIESHDGLMCSECGLFKPGEEPGAATVRETGRVSWYQDTQKLRRFWAKIESTAEEIGYLGDFQNLALKTAGGTLNKWDKSAQELIDDVRLLMVAATPPDPDPDLEPVATHDDPVTVDAETGEILPPTPLSLMHYSPSVERAISTFNLVVKMTNRKVLRPGIDYGPIPGTDKNALKKPGAEKLANAFGYCPEFEEVNVVRQWTGPEPLFAFEYRCNLRSIETGKIVATAIGECNSYESKYRWRWVQAHEVEPRTDLSVYRTRTDLVREPVFAIEKAETAGKYGKPADYWQRFNEAIGKGTASRVKVPRAKGDPMDGWEIKTTLYRVPNEDVFSLVNTISKMAQKRALIAAVLIGCNASEFFAQEPESLEEIA